MRKYNIFPLVLLTIFSFVAAGNVLATTHFTKCWEGSGAYNPMSLYVVEAKLNSVNLASGDEIGIFDGTQCVGAGDIGSTPPSFSSPLLVVASADDGGGCGFTVGHSITVKVWDASASMEFDVTGDVDFYDLSGNPVPTQSFAQLVSYGLGFDATVSVPQPEIDVTPSPHNYGNVLVGGSSSQTFTIYNTGTATLTISSITLVGGDAGQFSIDGATPTSVAAGGNQTFNVSFNPTSRGAKTTTLRIANNDANENPFDIALSGTGIAPVISITPNPHNYGNVLVGNNASQTFTVHNNGDAQLTLSDATISQTPPNQYSITSGDITTPVNLNPGETHNIVVQFSPTSVGLKSATLEVSSNDPITDPYDVPLSGTGVLPQLVVSPSPHDYGNVLIGGGSSSQAFSLQNTGTAVLTVSGVSLTGTNSDQFSIDTALGTLPWSINPGNSQTVNVSFNPTTIGPKTAILSIQSDDPDNDGIVDVNLSGNGIGIPNITVTPSSKNYGDVQVGSSASQNFQVGNNGTDTLIVSLFSKVGTNAAEFSIDSAPTTPVKIPPTASVSVDVSFNPTSTGAKSAALRITSNDPDDNPEDVPLSGNGTAVPTPDIAANPTSLGFGDTQVGSSKQLTVQISNTGNAELSVSSVSLTGTHAAQFGIVSGGSPFTIPVGSSTHPIVVSFTPASVGPKTAALRLASNDPDENPLDVPLTGNGTPEPTPDIAVDPASYNYGSVQVTLTKSQTFEVTNAGDALLTITDFSLTGTNAGEFSITSGDISSPLDLTPGATHDVTVEFAPTSVGAKTAALHITSNDPDENPLDVPLSGNATPEPAPDIDVHPMAINFGTVLIGSTGSDHFAIKNVGDLQLSVQSIALGGTNADQFALGSSGPADIDPGDSILVDVDFTPTSAGTKTAVATIYSNDPDEEVVEVDLTGNGEVPAPDIAVNPGQVDFGGVLLGTSSTKDVTVKNEGNIDLEVTLTEITNCDESELAPPASGGPVFEIVSGGAPFTLAPGASRIVKVKFTPEVEGPAQACLAISSNDPDESYVNVPLSGIGIYEPPVVRFYATPTSGYPKLSVKFEDDSEGRPFAWLWQFGDGATSTEQNPTHVYYRPGMYDVTLTITTAVGPSTLEKKNFIKVYGYGHFCHAFLRLVDNNYAPTKESWDAAIDEDVSGWVGTVSAKDTPPWAIFEFKDGTTKMIDQVRLLTDTDVDFQQRWVTSFSVFVSTTGIAAGNFTKILDGVKTIGGYEDFTFNPVAAKYIKLQLNVPTSDWRQIGEFQVCPVRQIGSPLTSVVTATTPHVGNGVDKSEVTIILKDDTGAAITGFTNEDFYLYPNSGQPILEPVVETATPGTYKTHIASLTGGNMMVEVMCNGVNLDDPVISFTKPALSKANINLVSASPTAPKEGWENATDGVTTGWEGTVTATGASPYAIFSFADGGIKALQKVNLLVDTDVGYANRWVKRFRIQVSTSGTKDTDFKTIFDGIQNNAKWQSHVFPAANARYVKLIIDYPTTGYKQLGEVEFEVSSALTAKDYVGILSDDEMLSIIGAPSEFSIKKNYPNPFNPETRIEFELPEEQHVSMFVFNALGQLVRTLQDGEMSAGYHAISWNGTNDYGNRMPSGLYFLRFQAGEYSNTQKMLMVQ